MGNFWLMVERRCAIDEVRRPGGFVYVCVSEARMRRLGRMVCNAPKILYIFFYNFIIYSSIN